MKLSEYREELNELFYDFIFKNDTNTSNTLHNCKLYKTGISVNFKYPADSKKVKLSLERRAMLSIFKNAFSMWEAGKHNKSIYEIIYSYKNNCEEINVEELLDNRTISSINCSESRTKLFLNFIYNKAIQIHENDSIRNLNRSRFFVTGDVGVGKTTFLNYLFSVNHKKLYDKRVIWIRVDLTKDYHNRESLKKSLEFQIAKVYRQHYFDDFKKNHFKIHKLIREYFMELSIEDTLREKEFVEALQVYEEPYDETRDVHYNEHLQRAIKKYIEKEYAVIYIYDGLDEKVNSNNYGLKLDEVKSILNNEHTHGVFIFVMRDESLKKLLLRNFDNYEISQLTNFRGYATTFKVNNPNLDDLFFKRLKLLALKWKDFLHENRRTIILPDLDTEEEQVNKDLLEIIHKFSWIDVNNIFHYFSIYKIYLSRALALDESDLEINNIENDAFTRLENLIHGNYRLLIQIINETFECFLENLELLNFDNTKIIECGVNIEKIRSKVQEFTNYENDLKSILSKHYRVISTLLRRNLSYTHPYAYYRDKSDVLSRKLTVAPEFTPYFFNLFYAVNDHERTKHPYGLLCKIRILQLLKRNPLLHEEIHNEIYSKFNYQSEQIQYSINELRESKFITDIVHNFDNELKYFLTITKKGLYTIDNLIFDFTYIRIMLDDILVPSDNKIDFQDRCPEDYQTNKAKWIIFQIPRIASFIRLINEFEEEEFENNSSLDKNEWKISNKMYDHFLNIVSRIVKINDPDLYQVKLLF